MRLCDGAGTPGLAAMAPRRGALVRPLLGVTRAEVLAYVRARRLRPVKDPSNRDLQYRRVRIRGRILPGLRAVEPDADRALARAADNLRDDAAVLAWAACHALEAAGFSAERCELDLAAWVELPAALRARALAAAVGQAGGRTPSRREVRALLALCEGTDGSASLDVGGLTVRRSYGRLALGVPAPPAPPEPRRITASGTIHFGGREITVELAPGVEVELRAPVAGDRVALAGGGHKKLARLFIDLKLPRAMRCNQPVIARPDSREVIAVPGLLPATGSTGVRVKACVDSPLTHRTGVQ
jgi:tRNA(Ile)-lysidine synthase